MWWTRQHAPDRTPHRATPMHYGCIYSHVEVPPDRQRVIVVLDLSTEIDQWCVTVNAPAWSVSGPIRNTSSVMPRHVGEQQGQQPGPVAVILRHPGKAHWRTTSHIRTCT